MVTIKGSLSKHSPSIHKQIYIVKSSPQDMREPKQAEEISGLLAAIVASSDDAIISKNLDGIIMSWNKSAERIFGYAPEEAIGQHITLIIPEERHAEESNILARLLHLKWTTSIEVADVDLQATVEVLWMHVTGCGITPGNTAGYWIAECRATPRMERLKVM